MINKINFIQNKINYRIRIFFPLSIIFYFPDNFLELSEKFGYFFFETPPLCYRFMVSKLYIFVQKISVVT